VGFTTVSSTTLLIYTDQYYKRKGRKFLLTLEDIGSLLDKDDEPLISDQDYIIGTSFSGTPKIVMPKIKQTFVHSISYQFIALFDKGYSVLKIYTRKYFKLRHIMRPTSDLDVDALHGWWITMSRVDEDSLSPNQLIVWNLIQNKRYSKDIKHKENCYCIYSLTETLTTIYIASIIDFKKE
jgi:hypothetical protein